MTVDGDGDRMRIDEGSELRDAAQIAAELVEEHQAICRRPLGVPTHAFYPAAQHRACRAMAASGLLTETADNIGNPTFVWTPLGLLVRAHLLGDLE